LGAGTQTSALSFGGYDSPSTPSANTGVTEKWNGTSWTTSGSLNTARRGIAGAGASNSASLAFAGLTTVAVTTVQNLLMVLLDKC
jgi:hypothetical protein